MKRRINYLLSIDPALDGVCHISTTYTVNTYRAQRVNGRKVISKRLCVYGK